MEEMDYFQNFDKDDVVMSDQVICQLDVMIMFWVLIVYGEMEEVKIGKEKVVKLFNGWKVKIDFEVKILKGKFYYLEYWFIFDKEVEIVVKLFEILLL